MYFTLICQKSASFNIFYFQFERPEQLCYRCVDVAWSVCVCVCVCLSVCLSVSLRLLFTTVSCAITSEPIQMPFGVLTCMSPKN